jgi:hypothetical protein
MRFSRCRLQALFGSGHAALVPRRRRRHYVLLCGGAQNEGVVAKRIGDGCACELTTKALARLSSPMAPVTIASLWKPLALLAVLVGLCAWVVALAGVSASMCVAQRACFRAVRGG